MGCDVGCCGSQKLEEMATQHLPFNPKMANCIALVVDDKKLFVWDANGEVRSFSYNGGGKISDLCFSSHGMSQADDLLTPCLDENGLHGDPDEGCFCGLDEPHLHVHVRDPDLCRKPLVDKSSISSSSTEAKLMKLARVTLHLSEAQGSHCPIPSSKEDFPHECTSDEIATALLQGREWYPMQHGNHTDKLILSVTKAGHVMYLQHDCGDCDRMDCHGVLGLGEQRFWNNEDKGGFNIALRFYRPAILRTEGTVSLNDLTNPIIFRSDIGAKQACSSISKLEPKSNKAAPSPCCGYAGLNDDKTSCSNDGDCCEAQLMSNDKTDVGSSCSGTAGSKDNRKSCCNDDWTCCEPEVKSTTKSDYCSSEKICRRDGEDIKCCGGETACCDPKNKSMDGCGKSSCCAGNGACCSGALHLEEQVMIEPEKPEARSTSTRSTFYVQNICCASEVAAIRSILEPLVGVKNMRANVTSKMVYVNHETDHISAADICTSLNDQMFGARIEQDGAVGSNAISAFVTSVLTFEDLGTYDKDTVEDFLSNLERSAVKKVIVDLDRKRITVIHNALLVPATEIVRFLSSTLGVESTVLTDGQEALVWEFPDANKEDSEEQVKTEPLGTKLRPTVVTAGVLWLISMLSFAGGNWEYLKYVALFSVAFGLPPIATKAAASLRACRFDVNCLMAFAAIGAVALQEYTEAAAVTFLFALSEWLEARATSRARNALSAILKLRPEKANLIHPQTGEVIVIPVGAVPVGALTSVKAGDKIPCDGVVLEGTSTVDESSLTGESRPVRKGPNDTVSGGTINSGNTQMTVRTTASADDSAVARLILLVEEAQANRSGTEKLVDEFARIYTPVLVSIALGMCTIPWAWGRDTGSEWTELGLVLIVVACPCALIISTPVSYVAGLAATAQRGVLIKGGAHLEALGLVKTVCFDKTGTLTQGKFQMLHLKTIGSSKTRLEVLEFLALIEDRASHPLSMALVEGAQSEGVKIPKGRFVQNHTFLPGEGVSGIVDGLNVYVGNVRLFERLGLYQGLTKSERKVVEEWERIGTVGFMSIGDDGIVCAYCVADAVRPESAEVVEKLKRLNIDTLMLTGDNNETAVSIGSTVGLCEQDIRSDLLPEGKLTIVSELKAEHRGSQSILSSLCTERRLVLMCGDGVNDAPALATANVGVAVVGSALAMETADVTLMDSNLEKLVQSIEMGRRVIKKIKENVIFSLVVKFTVLGFALAGMAALWAAIASDVGAMLLVTLNSMTLLPTKDERKNSTRAKEVDSSGRNADEGFYRDKINAKIAARYQGRPEQDDELLSVASV